MKLFNDNLNVTRAQPLTLNKRLMTMMVSVLQLADTLWLFILFSRMLSCTDKHKS